MDDNTRLGLRILAIIIFVVAGVVWACSEGSGCGDECNSNAIININQSQPPQPVTTEVVKTVEVPVYTPTPIPQPQPVTYINVAANRDAVYLCRGEGLSFCVSLGTVDPPVKFYIDGRYWRTFSVYQSLCVDWDRAWHLEPGYHTVTAVATIPGHSEGSDTDTFRIGECHTWGTPCCCPPVCCPTCPVCPNCYPVTPPPPTPTPPDPYCPPPDPVTPPPPPPGPTPGQPGTPSTPSTPSSSGAPVNPQSIE